MDFQEGQIYEGTVSLSGGEGPLRRWIVVAPFGRVHVHSIDDPMDLHCWPISVLIQGLEAGRLHYVGREPGHPEIRLQRRKEAEQIEDTHLGLSAESLERMFSLLEQAVADGEDYAHFAAGEIFAFVPRSERTESELRCIRERAERILAGAQGRSVGDSAPKPIGFGPSESAGP